LKSIEEAKTIQAFLISGLFSNYDHVVNLTPVESMTDQELATMTAKVDFSKLVASKYCA
jgi:hypothetical protein